MTILDKIILRAKAAPKRIILTEGEDDRILIAAERLSKDKVAEVTVLGDVAQIEAKALTLKLNLEEVSIIDPASSELRDPLADLLVELRAKKGMTKEKAYDLAGQSLWFANLSVKAGHQDGVVSGAVHTKAANLVVHGALWQT